MLARLNVPEVPARGVSLNGVRFPAGSLSGERLSNGVAPKRSDLGFPTLHLFDLVLAENIGDVQHRM